MATRPVAKAAPNAWRTALIQASARSGWSRRRVAMSAGISIKVGTVGGSGELGADRGLFVRPSDRHTVVIFLDGDERARENQSGGITSSRPVPPSQASDITSA